MTKCIARLILLAALLALLSLSAAAQSVFVRGICKDEAGKPIAGGVVQFQDLTSGKTISVTTGERGEYSSMDVPPGSYKITLFGPDNKPLFSFDRMTFQSDSQYNLDFDLATLPSEPGNHAVSRATRGSFVAGGA